MFWNWKSDELDQARRRILDLEARLAEKAAEPELHCSFCDKGSTAVSKLIAGPRVFICNECVAECVNVICGAPKGGAQ